MRRIAICAATFALTLGMTGLASAQSASGTAEKPATNAPKSGENSDIKQQESKGGTVKAGPNAATGTTASGNAGAGGGATPASQ